MPGRGATARQIAAVVRHELAGLGRDGRIRIALLTIGVLVAIAVVAGLSQHRRHAEDRAAAAAIERDRWTGQSAKNSHDATHYGIYVFKPPPPLAALDRGIEAFVGVGLWLEAHRVNLSRHRPIEDVTAVSRFGELSAASSLQVLAPLVLLLAGYASVAGERDAGTLRQVLLAGPTGPTLVMAKAAALLAAVALVGVPLAVAASAAILASQSSPLEWTRLAAMGTAYALYLAGWAVLAVAVSTWARTSRTALVVLLSLWFAGCVIGPRLAGDLAARVYPVPNPIAFRQALEADLGRSSAERVAGRKARILREYGVERTEDLPIDWRGISLQEEEERSSAIFAEHFDRLVNTYRAQNHLLQIAGLVAPVLAVQAVSQAAAGTDFELHRRFLHAAEAYRQEIQRLMNADVTANDREGTDYKADPRLWATVPPFRFEPPPFADTWPTVEPAAIALVAWLSLASLALVIAVRYRAL